MEPRQALQVIDQVGANFTGNRQDHDNIRMAVAVLQGVVMDQEVAKKEEAMKSAAEKKDNAEGETQVEEQGTAKDEEA